MVNHGQTTEENKVFFYQFLDVVEELFKEASDRKGVTRFPSFLFSRLMEYIADHHGDIERVYAELQDDPGVVLERILSASKRSGPRGTQTVVTIGRPEGFGYDIIDLWDQIEDRES